MANSTIEYWEADGISLHQYGWAVTTVGGSRYDLPQRRGENIQYAYRPGKIWRPKQPDERPITLPMFLTGMDPATGNYAGDQMLRWNDSWDFLRRLVWRLENRLFPLTRRTYLTIDGTPQILVAVALAELNGTMAPTMTGRSRSDFTIDLVLPDPYFYGSQRAVPLTKGTPVSIFNPGHDLSAFSNLSIVIQGPLTNPRVTNATPSPQVWVQLNGTVAAGQTLTLDVGQYTATMTGTGVGDVTAFASGLTLPNQIGNIVHSGARHWMGLQPGPNLVTLSAASGTGSAEIRYRPPYV